ncbi:MAG: HNH endonuclease [Caldilineaceae bacterium]|nr:HNH endonuclease [Caldilineaceae bacterium]
MARKYIPVALDQRIRKDARHRCGYCLSPQHLVMARLEIEHIVPLSKGGSDDESNLWLACPICNRHKANKTTGIDPESGEESPLFNPRQQTWSEHFRWDESGLYLIGLTALGRATIAALQMNEDIDALMVRSYWIEAGWHPPSE